MGFFITEQELCAVRAAQPGSRVRELYDSMRARCARDTRADRLMQEGDTQEWYHLVWERMSDASFVYAVDAEPRLGAWVHDRALELARMSHAEWVGPWYRFNLQERYHPAAQEERAVGALETGHITMAVCETLENCTGLFSDAEQAELRDALRTKGMPMCHAFCDETVARHTHINNWFTVLLNGYGTAAMVLGEPDEIEHALRLSDIAAGLYNEREYGESVQYSNYASLSLCSLYEHALRYGIPAERLHMGCYARLMPWYAASYLYNKPIDSLGVTAPRTINFGDCAAIFRPTGDVLAQVAARLQAQFPRESGLARWLFEQTYSADVLHLPNELASFGFINQFQYPTLLLYSRMAAPMTPRQATLSEAMCFGGQVIVRDQWAKPKAVVAMAPGYEPYGSSSHRHFDQGSFQAVYGGERLLSDPGHCCYRLQAWQKSRDDTSHNTFTLTRGGQTLHQKLVTGNTFQPEPSMCRRLFAGYHGDVFVTGCDMTALFGAPVKKALRIFLLKLPHMMFVADVAEASEPLGMDTHFLLNNRANRLRTHIYNEQKLVFRRGSAAMKLFELESVVDGAPVKPTLEFDWSYMHDYYHPLPNQVGQGKEGSGLCYAWRGTPGLVQTRLCSIVMADEPDIKGWHVAPTADGFFRMEAPGASDALEVRLAHDGIMLRQPTLGTEERIAF